VTALRRVGRLRRKKGGDLWLDFCRGAVRDVQEVLARMPTRNERETVVGTGAGGDETTAIDAESEAAIVRRLERLHARERVDFHLVSEELGERVFGDSPSLRVVVDPIDGSLNAKRNIPFFSLSIAVAEGSTMEDVFFGLVYDFGSGEEWTASRGGGAWLNGERLGTVRPKDEIEVLAVEATVAGAVADKAESFAGFAKRLRIMGSLALSLCYLAAGRVDAVCSLKEARAVDIAAAQLLLREVGMPIVFADAGPFLAGPLDTAARSPVAAAGTRELCERLAHMVAT
jgi:myo-inositol-1(or 4)-monophosphatase